MGIIALEKTCEADKVAVRMNLCHVTAKKEKNHTSWFCNKDIDPVLFVFRCIINFSPGKNIKMIDKDPCM